MYVGTLQVCGRIIILVGTAYAPRRVPSWRSHRRPTADHVGELTPAGVPSRRRRVTGAGYFQQYSHCTRDKPHTSELNFKYCLNPKL